MYRSLFILLPTLAFALPSLNKRDDESIWKASDGKGNIKVYFSDTNTNWGDWEPSTWLDDLDCDSAHCKDITRKTKILDTIPEDYDVKLSFNEDYNPDMLEDMTAALKAALYESSKKYEKRWMDCVCGGMGFCDAKEKWIDQYWGPEAINVRYTSSNGEDSNMKFELSLKSSNEAGLCETLVKIAGGIASGVNGAVAGGLSVAELLCDKS